MKIEIHIMSTRISKFQTHMLIGEYSSDCGRDTSCYRTEGVGDPHQNSTVSWCNVDVVHRVRCLIELK